MKTIKNLFLSLLGISAMLSSCSKADDLLAENNGNQQVTFSLLADGLEQTRATSDGLRYVMAIYDETGMTEVVPEQIYDKSSFSVRLDQGTYTCLFWADHGSANYDAADLTAITAKANSADDANAEAFYAKQTITVTKGNAVTVTLRRAVAQVILRETSDLEAGTLTVSYTDYQQFNVSTGTASQEAGVSKTIPIASAISGSESNPKEVCSLFLLANSTESKIGTFKVKYQDGEEKSITNVPIQANCKTHLNGKFGVKIPYITFKAESEQTFAMKFSSFTLGEDEYFEYSVGGGNWTQFTTTVSGIPFGGTKGDLRLRGKSSRGTATSESQYCTISFGTTAVKVDCTGDIRTLINYANHETDSTSDARFCNLFKDNQSLSTAPVLPATTLKAQCYYNMFYGCTALTSAPALPATTLADKCYYGMFQGCTTLTSAPALPATTLADKCYSGMFQGCTALTTAPALPATKLTIYCYFGMFQGCTALTTAPALPATTLAFECYSGMFQDCTALTTAPALPATTLMGYCYYGMFKGCSLLSDVKMLGTNIDTDKDQLTYWLKDAGTAAPSRTLTLASQTIYNSIKKFLPNIWKKGAKNTTVKFENK